MNKEISRIQNPIEIGVLTKKKVKPKAKLNLENKKINIYKLRN